MLVTSHDQQEWVDLRFTSHDGLRLAGRHYPAMHRNGTASTNAPPPLLCLSSLTGSSEEFHRLARFLSHHPEQPRNVYCLDYRGRGQSQRDRFSAHYSSRMEVRDILDFLIAFDLSRFDLLGSSRGGINAMLLASARPGALNSVILNDLGPVLEPAGVARIMGYLANMPSPASWSDAVDLVRSMYQVSFPALDEGDWQAFTRRYFFEQEDKAPVPAYDTRLSLPGRRLDLQKTLPDMWKHYLALFRHPLLIIRGENSDMLSRQTVEHMRTLHWRAKAVTVPGQGHAPLLRDRPSLQTIHAFLQENTLAQKNHPVFDR